MAIADDFSIDTNGDIRYIGANHGQAGAGYYTVLDFHRWLQDLADDASASGDDLLDITDETPSDRSTDNIITLFEPYNIDDATAEHLFDGSIIQDNGDTIYDGIVNFGVEGIHITLVQNGQVIANDFWNSTPDGEALSGLNRDTTAGVSHRFMIKVRDGGADIDGRRILGLSREFGKTYTYFKINGTARGNNVLALTNSVDLNNQTDESTVAGWSSDIVNNNEGYVGLDVDNDGTIEHYYSEWSIGGSLDINDFYEYMKYLARSDASGSIYGVDARMFLGITHEVDISNISGAFNEPEKVTWTGGSGQVLATDNTAKLWIQLLTGVSPASGDTITGVDSGATADAGVTIDRPISPTVAGASTGSAIIGAYGLGINPTDLTNADKLFDLSNIQHTPPNYVTFYVQGLVAGEDRVLVAPEHYGDIEYDQFTLAADITAGDTDVQVDSTIPSDTPASGTIRVFDGSVYQLVSYTGYSGDTFTGCSDTPTATAGSNVWISYIDKVADSTTESFTGVYTGGDRSLFIRVRDGGNTPIKTFETTGTLGSAGGSTTAIRTSDA